MTYAEAKKALRKVGCAHATGDSLAAMYADLVIIAKGVNKHTAEKFYEHFRKQPDDGAIFREGKRMLTDLFAIFDVI